MAENHDFLIHGYHFCFFLTHMRVTYVHSMMQTSSSKNLNILEYVILFGLRTLSNTRSKGYSMGCANACNTLGETVHGPAVSRSLSVKQNGLTLLSTGHS